MKTICWAYAEDGRVCREPATIFDQQRGFMVCARHARIRGQHKQTQDSNMSKTKAQSEPPTAATGPTAAATDQPTYRNNPEVDAKIDAHIRENPKYWAYVQAMPRERLERALILTEVQKIDRQQRMREGLMTRINANPELKQAFDTLVKNVPEEQRENVIAQIATQTRRTIARSQSAA
jgi:hypothetical protein